MKKSLNINKHASSLCVNEELDWFLITHRPWPMAIKYWLRNTTGTQNRRLNEAYKTAIHEKHNWVQCIQAYWILMDLAMFGLTPSLLVLFPNCLKHVWAISLNREGEVNYSPQVDLTNWNISLKMIVKNYTYTKLEILVLGKLLLDWESTWTFYQHAVSTRKCTCLPAVFQGTGVCFCTLFWNVLCMIDSAIYLLTKLFRVHRLSWIGIFILKWDPGVQNVQGNVLLDHVLLCFVELRYWLIKSLPWRLLHWHGGHWYKWTLKNKDKLTIYIYSQPV